jgi:hypothetical protein
VKHETSSYIPSNIPTRIQTEGSAPVHKQRHHTKTENRASTVDTDICQDHWTEEPLRAADGEKKKNNRPEKLKCPTLTSNLPIENKRSLMADLIVVYLKCNISTIM